MSLVKIISLSVGSLNFALLEKETTYYFIHYEYQKVLILKFFLSASLKCTDTCSGVLSTSCTRINNHEWLVLKISLLFVGFIFVVILCHKVQVLYLKNDKSQKNNMLC